ncbi:MAG: hypothetical protein WAT70_07140 [Rhizobiaceae bacterium]
MFGDDAMLNRRFTLIALALTAFGAFLATQAAKTAPAQRPAYICGGDVCVRSR